MSSSNARVKAVEVDTGVLSKQIDRVVRDHRELFSSTRNFANGQHCCLTRLSNVRNFDDLKKFSTDFQAHLEANYTRSGSTKRASAAVQFYNCGPSRDDDGSNDDVDEDDVSADAAKSDKKRKGRVHTGSPQKKAKSAVRQPVGVTAGVAWPGEENDQKPGLLAGLFIPDERPSLSSRNGYPLFLFQGDPMIVREMFHWLARCFDCAMTMATFPPVLLERAVFPAILDHVVSGPAGGNGAKLNLVFSFPVPVAQAGLSTFSLTVNRAPLIELQAASGGDRTVFHRDAYAALRQQVRQSLSVDLDELSLASVAGQGMYLSCAGHIKASNGKIDDLLKLLFAMEDMRPTLDIKQSI